MVWAQSLPPAAERYWQEQHRHIEDADRAVARIWAEVAAAPELVGAFRAAEPDVLTVVQAAQLRLAESAQPYTEQVLADMGQPVRPVGQVIPGSLVGLAGDGRALPGLARLSVSEAFTQMEAGLPRVDALGVAGRLLSMLMTTAMADIARAAERAAAGSVQASGWVRLLEPPSCSRCAVLAGRVYATNEGFQRHPRCDCRHVPTMSQTAASDLVADPRRYFESLSQVEQDRIFTEAGAEAIRNGADVARVVNARRGMVTAQSGRSQAQRLFGRDLYLTRTGWRSGGRQVRLMPESLAEIAGGDKEEFVRLLRAHGYLI